jgi:phospholipid transport system transporter-binding protein
MDASLSPGGDHRWVINGDLDFTTVPRLWSELAPCLDGSDWVLDLAGVGRGNSAGLALLLEAHQVTRRKGGRMTVAGLPASLAQLGQMSGLAPLLAELSG